MFFVFCFRYIAAVTNTSGQSEIERAKNVLLHSNDILEAFGNAKVYFVFHIQFFVIFLPFVL